MKGARSSPRAIPSRLIPKGAGDVEEKAPHDRIDRARLVDSTFPSWVRIHGVRGGLEPGVA